MVLPDQGTPLARHAVVLGAGGVSAWALHFGAVAGWLMLASA